MVEAWWTWRATEINRIHKTKSMHWWAMTKHRRSDQDAKDIKSQWDYLQAVIEGVVVSHGKAPGENFEIFQLSAEGGAP